MKFLVLGVVLSLTLAACDPHCNDGDRLVQYRSGKTTYHYCVKDSDLKDPIWSK